MCLTPNIDPADWQTGKTPLECTKYMLEKELNCDVNFKVGENEESIKAHKLILSMRSAVFDRMFNGGFQESEKDPVIPDVTGRAFKTLLRYCYYECLDIEDDVALDLLYASTKYMLPLLEEAARKKLIQILNGSNIWDIYKYATSVGDKELYEVSKSYFVGSVIGVREALQADTFLNIPHETLLEFLHINDKDKTADLNEVVKDANNSDDGEGTEETVGDKVIGEEDHETKGNDEEEKEENIRHDKDNTLHINENVLNGDNFDSNNPDDRQAQEQTREEGKEENDEEDKVKEATKYEKSVDCKGISISEIELFQACNAWAEAECLRQEIDPTGANKRIVLGEGLFLIRFPTILLKDLVTVVYPIGILTQTEIADLGQFMNQDPGSECHSDFPSKGRDFVVTPPTSTTYCDTGVVVIECTERVLLSRIWTTYPGNYRVTLTNESSERSWYAKNTQYENHCTKLVNAPYILYFIDINGQVLDAGGSYCLTIELKQDYEHSDDDPNVTEVEIAQLAPFKEVKLSNKSGTSSIYALTLCLI